MRAVHDIKRPVGILCVGFEFHLMEIASPKVREFHRELGDEAILWVVIFPDHVEAVVFTTTIGFPLPCL